MRPIVLSLCDRTGNMVRPWAEAGYECWCLDIQHEEYHVEGNIHYAPIDVFSFDCKREIVMGFAFPPCTHLCVSGARWWDAKPQELLEDSLNLVDKCWNIISKADAYVLENPVGRLSDLWRPPDYIYNPSDYGGYLDPPGDHYTKKTCLWAGGNFMMPPPRPVRPTEGSKMHKLPPSKDRQNLRSETPMGFSTAVFQYNRR